MDYVLSDANGREMKQVHFRDAFRRPHGGTARLVPSADSDAVNAVLWGMNAIAEGRASLTGVMREFNARGLRTVLGKPFILNSIIRIMENPAYAGIARIGHFSRGKFSRIDDGIIIIEKAHEGIVSPETFEMVQSVIQSRRVTKLQKHEPRLLRGIVYCSSCGLRMTQGVMVNKKNGRDLTQYRVIPVPYHDIFASNRQRKLRLHIRSLADGPTRGACQHLQ